MAYPDDLPTCVDGSLGRAKVDTSAYTDKGRERRRGRGYNGSSRAWKVSPRSFNSRTRATFRPWSHRRSRRDGTQPLTPTGHGEIILPTHGFVRVTADYYGPRRRPPHRSATSLGHRFHLVPSDYGGAGIVTINGVADIAVIASGLSGSDRRWRERVGTSRFRCQLHRNFG